MNKNTLMLSASLFIAVQVILILGFYLSVSNRLMAITTHLTKLDEGVATNRTDLLTVVQGVNAYIVSQAASSSSSKR